MTKPNLLRFAFLAAGFLSGLAASPVPAAETAEALFRKAVEQSGKEYEEMRSELLVRPDEAIPILEEALKAKDWRTRVTAEAIRGWIRRPKAYQELWAWEAPHNNFRNPYPRMAAQAQAKFNAAGKDAIPLMLEIVWKKGDTKYGAIPQLLSEWKVESAVPVLVEWLATSMHDATGSAVPEAVGRFGELATPHLLASLRDANAQARPGLVKALGLTGDAKAAGELRNCLKNDPEETVREQAAHALGALLQFPALREDLPALKASTQREVLRVLGSDKSDETRQVLRRFAETGETASLRQEAVEALLHKATAKDVAAVCEIAPKEPDDTHRSNMYLYLGANGKYQKNQLARNVLLDGLKDRVELVRVRAIEGLQIYDDPEVNQALLPLLAAKDLGKRSALWVLKERQDPAIVEAVVPLLGDQDNVIRGYAAEVLSRNRAERALKPLIGLLDDGDLHTRRHAADAITLIGGEAALAALTRALPAEKEEIVKERIKLGIEVLSRKPTK